MGAMPDSRTLHRRESRSRVADARVGDRHDREAEGCRPGAAVLKHLLWSAFSLGRPLRRVLAAASVVFVLSAAADHACAYDVEPDSSGNRLYVLLWHGNLAASLDSINVLVDMPGFTSTATADYVPTSVPADSGLLAGFSFDVLGVATGTSGDAVVTVTGTVAGNPVLATLNVPLTTAADAPAIVIYSLLGNEGEDSDADGVSNSVELHYGSDPLDPNDLPGTSVLVLALSSAALAIAAFLMAVIAVTTLLRLERGRRSVSYLGCILVLMLAAAPARAGAPTNIDVVVDIPSCGNTLIEAGEQCDDGNLASGDLCSNTCQDECPSGGAPDCYSVDEAGLGGACNDGVACNDNTPATPFCSLARALACVNQGPSQASVAIRLRAGTYAESGLQLSSEGLSPESPLLLFATPNETAILSESGSAVILTIDGGDDIHLRNLHFDLHASGQALMIGSNEVATQRLRIENCTFTGGSGFAIDAKVVRESDFIGNTFSGGGRSLVILGSQAAARPIGGTLESYGNWVIGNTFEPKAGFEDKSLFYGFSLSTPVGARRGRVHDNFFLGSFISMDSWVDGVDVTDNTFGPSSVSGNPCDGGLELNGRNALVSGNEFTCMNPIKSRMEDGSEIPQGFVDVVISASEFEFQDGKPPSPPAHSKAPGTHQFYDEVGIAAVLRWGHCIDAGMPTNVPCRYFTECGTGQSCDSEWRLVQSWQHVAPDRAHVVVDSDFSSLLVGDFVEIAPHFHSITIENNEFFGSEESAILTTWKGGYLTEGSNFDNWLIQDNKFRDIAKFHPDPNSSEVSGVYLQAPGNTQILRNTSYGLARGFTARPFSPFGTPTLTIRENCFKPNNLDDVAFEFFIPNSNGTVLLEENYFDDGKNLPVGWELINFKMEPCPP